VRPESTVISTPSLRALVTDAGQAPF